MVILLSAYHERTNHLQHMNNRLRPLRFVFPFSLSCSISRLLVIGFVLISVCVQGQPGALDLTFDTGSGASSMVSTIALQPDGKILIGGWFSSFNGVPAKRIARLYPDGTFDDSFNTSIGASSGVFSIVLQPDGKVLIGGQFGSYNEIAVHKIARLNADGSLDDTFNTGSGANTSVLSVALQPDGKILIGGNFITFNGISVHKIARLNSDGTLDETFNTDTGLTNWVHSIVLQSEGKVLIGGSFTTFSGNSVNRIARLNPDGTLDNTFNTGTGANGTVESIAVQPDGKVLIGGQFTTYSGISANGIARLNPDGTLDDTFNTNLEPSGAVRTIALQPDGKVLIGGWFSSISGVPAIGIARLNGDGTMDSTFNTGSGVSDFIDFVTLQPDGKVLVGGNFYFFNGYQVNYITRLLGGVATNVSEYGNGHSLKSYPNPFKHQVEIQTADVFSGNDYQYEVMDVTGHVFIPREILRTRERLIIDFEGMTNGVYLIRLTDGERNYTVRMVKV